MPPTASPGDLRDAVKARDAVAVARALSGGCKPDDAAERRTLHGAPEVLRGAPGNPVALEPQSVPPLVAAAEGGMADIARFVPDTPSVTVRGAAACSVESLLVSACS